MAQNNDGGVSASLRGPAVSVTPADGGRGNKWLNFFGPTQGDVHSGQYDKYSYTTYDLPEAYKGKNLYLRDTIDGLITGDTSHHTWYTSPACLPYQETDQIHMQWNVWQFNRTLAGQVPHEGISRLITSSKRSYKESTVRHGLAFYIEHGFMNTAEGVSHYQKSLRGIAQCVQETNNYDVIATLLHSNRYDRECQLKHGDYNRPMSEILRREVSEWAVVQKSGYGLDWMVEEYKEHLSRHGGVVPTTFIIPPKMALYMTMADPVKTQFLYAGQDGVQTLREGPSALTNYRGINVFKTHAFDVYEGELPIDLLRRDMQIGEFYTMRDTLTDHKQYKNFMRDITIYDESLDDWKRIHFEEALTSCSRFGQDGSLLSRPGDDMFTVEGYPGTNVTLLGQVRPSYLNAQQLTAVAETLDPQNRLSSEERNHLSAGLALLETWSTLSVEPNADVVSSFHSTQSPVVGPVPFLYSGAIDYSSNTANVIPANFSGCCNWVMLRAIVGCSDRTKVSSHIHTTVLHFRAVVKKLYRHLKRVFPESYLLNHREAGSAFLTCYLPEDEEKNLCTFFENCVGQHYQPLWHLTGLADSSSSSSSTAAAAVLSFTDGPCPGTGKSSQGQTILSALQQQSGLNDTRVTALLSELFQLQRDNGGTPYDTDLSVTMPRMSDVKAFAKKIKEMDESEKTTTPVLSTSSGDAYVTPYSCTPALGDLLLTTFDYPNPLLGGYSPLGKQRTLSVANAHISAQAPSSDFASLGVMQNQMEIGPHMSTLKRSLAPDERGSWADSRKRYKHNVSIDEYVDQHLFHGGDSANGGSDDLALTEFASVGAPFQAHQVERRAGRAWHLITQGGAMRHHVDNVAAKQADVVSRASIMVFLFTPASRHSLNTMFINNVHMPFSILLARPWMTYQMSSAILMKGGYDTGATFVGHADFQLGDDVASKVHYGNYTYYSKAIVQEPKNVIVMENVLANKYIAGNGTGFYTSSSDFADSLHTSQAKRKGLISMIIPATCRVSNPMSLTGRFERDNVDHEESHYEGSEWYSSEWQFKDMYDVDDQELIQFDQSHRDANSVCWQGHQYSWKQYPDGGGGHTSITRNSGHWGPDVYPGCGRIRSGEGKVFQEQHYTQDPM